jgi:hypothetical protein
MTPKVRAAAVLVHKSVGTTLCPKCNILNLVRDNILRCNCKFVANIIDCACECGEKLLDRDNEGRLRRFTYGHWSRAQGYGDKHHNSEGGLTKRISHFSRWRSRLKKQVFDILGNRCAYENEFCHGLLERDHKIPLNRNNIKGKDIRGKRESICRHHNLMRNNSVCDEFIADCKSIYLNNKTDDWESEL